MRFRLAICATTCAGLAASAVLAGAGPARAARPTPAAVAGPAVTWAPCSDPDLKPLECGSLAVPLDYDAPHGATVVLALSRSKHTGSHYKGIMLTNPGGPGGSGLFLASFKDAVPNQGGADYDWIGFDPRGVGASVPAITCDRSYVKAGRPPYVPQTPQIEAAWLALARGYQQACFAHSTAQNALLQHMHTTDNVRDMESIRQALGSRLLNFYGYSYGTYLGMTYATMFPNRVGRMVLDSNVDPRKVWYQANLDQDPAFEIAIEAWFDWVAGYDSVYHLGQTQAEVEQAYYRILEQVGRTPGGGTVGPAEWSDAFLLAGYAQSLWPDLADAFADAVRGDWAGASFWWQAADGVGDDNGYAVYLATQCSDAPWPTSWKRIRRDNRKVYRHGAQFVTWANAWFNAPCTTWPVAGQKPVRIDGSHVTAPILLIDETLDAATPYSGSLEVRKRFPSARLLAEPGGTSHANSLGGNACVDNTVSAYLKSGTLPARVHGNKQPDATCAPLPLPIPIQLQPPVAAAVSHTGRAVGVHHSPAGRARRR